MVMEDIMTNENENNDNILIIEAGDRPELYPHVVLKGNSANLSALRGTDAQTRSIFFEERNNNNSSNDDEDVTPSTPPLLMESSVFVSLMMTTDADADDENEDENKNNNTFIQGEMFITNTQILFVAIERDQSQYDLAIGAACIVLHAMTDEPELSVYLQLSSSSSSCVGEQQQQQQQPPTEVTLTPIHNENDNDCQRIFDALCKLISLNPIEPDDDDDGGGSGGGNMMMDGMFGLGGTGTGGFVDDNDGDDDIDDDGFIWAPTTAASSNNKTSDGTATTSEEEERDAMLERLDNLLIVPPQFEDGQFDDAIEENDD